jgi:hypothetical protein
MVTDTQVARPPAPSREISDPDPPDDDQANSHHPLTQATPDRRSGVPQFRLSPDFAKLQASNILLAMGIVVFILGFVGCAAFVISHGTIAALFVVLGLLTVIISARLGWLVLLKLDCHFGGILARFGLKNATESDPGPDDSPDA